MDFLLIDSFRSSAAVFFLNDVFTFLTEGGKFYDRRTAMLPEL
jgi:hypothetical protein